MDPDERVLLMRVAAGIVGAAVFLANLRTVPIELGLFELPVPLSLFALVCLVSGGVLALRLRLLMIRRLGPRNSRRRGDHDGPRPRASTEVRAARSDTHASWLEQRRSPFD